ncbi:MAG: TAXI family TRAP transporter solute-binding subunit, partial [Albimonas sp.]
MKHLRALCAAGVAAAALAAPLKAQDLELPGQLVWTAYDTGSSGYAQAVAIGAAMQDATGTNLRVLPGKNDIARMEPVRQGRAPFSAMGVGIYMLQEGVFEFGTDRWGPQSVRLVAMNNSGEAALA